MQSAKARRTQSMKTHVSTNEIERDRRPGSPSASSSSSASSVKASETEPLTSQSTKIKEVELVENKHVNFNNLVTMTEADAARAMDTTRIDPMRDGVYARVRNALLQHGTSLVLGAGVGGLITEQRMKNNNRTESSMLHINTTVDADSILSAIG